MGYANPRWAVRQLWKFRTTGALNATTASATEKYRQTLSSVWPVKINAAKVTFTAGGTEAAKNQLVLGKSLAGTGAFSAIGTHSLATHATADVVDWSVTGTLTAADDLVLAYYGTSTEVYDAIVSVDYSEQFDASTDE